MLKPADYESAKAYDGDFQMIQPGGYVCKILKAESITRNDSPMINLFIDIEEGEYKGIMRSRFDKEDPKYRKWPCQYSSFVYGRDGGTNPYYKGLLTCIERSNGMKIDWDKDESQFNKKLIGIIFRAEEYIGRDGNKRIAVKPYAARDVETIRSGDFKVPEMKTLDGTAPSATAAFEKVEPSDDLPF